MATRGVSCGWSKRKTRARTRSSYVKVSHRAMRSAPTRRPYGARRVGGGSALPTPRMSSGIRACCLLVMRAARHSSHPGGATDMPVAASVHTSKRQRSKTSVTVQVDSSFRLPDFHDRSLSRGQKLSRPAREERGCKSLTLRGKPLLDCERRRRHHILPFDEQFSLGAAGARQRDLEGFDRR